MGCSAPWHSVLGARGSLAAPRGAAYPSGAVRTTLMSEAMSEARKAREAGAVQLCGQAGSGPEPEGSKRWANAARLAVDSPRLTRHSYSRRIELPKPISSIVSNDSSE